ncbi:hypothetical protein MM239_09990 [Belliella sp. DSM 111904]|uniref:Uncharacterized protein n=1 Tax=Belliella filtrata TaxID=2923435 RepID=A0ABS9V0I4_9BACT|nr:hypothetical protein [Belliella filtrata]MCH7409725.1 hypothetical protein [Belliella filtrata]
MILKARSGADYVFLSKSPGLLSLNDWIYPITGRIVFRGTSRTIVTNTSWSAQNDQSKFTAVFDPDPEQILTVNAPFKSTGFIIQSGTIIQTNCSIFSFNSNIAPTGPFGEFVLESGATLISNALTTSNPIIRLSGTRPVSLLYKNGANLILRGQTPYIEAASVLLEGTIVYGRSLG